MMMHLSPQEQLLPPTKLPNNCVQKSTLIYIMHYSLCISLFYNICKLNSLQTLITWLHFSEMLDNSTGEWAKFGWENSEVSSLSFRQRSTFYLHAFRYSLVSLGSVHERMGKNVHVRLHMSSYGALGTLGTGTISEISKSRGQQDKLCQK